MRVTKDPDTRKQEILDAAIRVFARKGYEKASIADIAQEMGVSQGLCYRYFPSKEVIYDAAIEEYAQYIAMRNISSYHYEDLPFREQVDLLSGNMDLYTSAEKGKDDLYQMFHQEGTGKLHDQLFLKVAQKVIPFLTRIIKRAKEKGEIQVQHPETAARFFTFGQLGILMDNELEMEEKNRRILEMAYMLFGFEEKK